MKSKWMYKTMFILFLLSFAQADKYKEFKPVEIWEDNNGVHVKCPWWRYLLIHEGIYYWFGEHKIEGIKSNNVKYRRAASKALFGAQY